MARIFSRSWSELEAHIELEKLRSTELKNEWIDGHQNYQRITLDDVWLTTNGFNYIHGAGFKQISWHAESYVYNKNNYDLFPTDDRFDLRFHFNPNMCQYPKTEHLPIYTWWKDEMALYKHTANNKKPEFTFGMVLARKNENRQQFPSCYLGWLRSHIVQAGKGRSMKYYGSGWEKNDPNYGGEAYISGNVSSPEKFHDARILMTKAKFVWAVENTHDYFYSQNYLTEKIWHAFISASVPIYVGACNVHEMIDPSLFIDLRKFNYNPAAAMDYCEKMTESEYQGYIERIGNFLEKEGQKYTGESVFKELDFKINKFLCND